MPLQVMKHGCVVTTPKLSSSSSQLKPFCVMTVKAHKVHNKTKVMLTVFFDHEVLHIINMLEEQIINQHFYLVMLRCLHGAAMMNSRKSVDLASSKFTMTVPHRSN
jgi:hypothetical protein